MILVFVLLSILLFVLLWFLADSERVPWTLKMLISSLVLYSMVSVFYLSDSLKGWPTGDPVPENFVLGWVIIQEPDGNSDGAIYLWATPIDFGKNCKKYLLCLEDSKLGQPRNYKIDYTEEAHEKFEGIMGELMGGKVILGKESDMQDGEHREYNKYGVEIDDFILLELEEISDIYKKDVAK